MTGRAKITCRVALKTGHFCSSQNRNSFSIEFLTAVKEDFRAGGFVGTLGKNADGTVDVEAVDKAAAGSG